MVITYNPGPMWSSPGWCFYCRRGWVRFRSGKMLRSWVVECRLRSWRGSASVEDCRGPLRWTSDVNSSYPLRVEAFHNSISPNGPCSGISCHHWKSEGTTVDHFQVGLGPGGAHQAFLFHWNTWTDIFFYRHKFSYFFLHRGRLAGRTLGSDARDQMGTFTLISAPTSGVLRWTRMIKGL